MMKNLRCLFVATLMSVSVGFLGGCIGPDRNRPPSAPSIICPSEAEVNEEVVVTFRSTDPDRDELCYRIRFGDGDETWSDYHPSGEEAVVTHKYKEALSYGVTARAYDRRVVSEWSEEKWIRIKTSQPPPEIRLISVVGTCLPGREDMIKELGGANYDKMSAYGNRTDWPNYEEMERLGMKVIINIRDDLSEAGIRDMVLKWKDRPVCGGYWCDKLGHEPDITNPPMEERKRFYNTVRKYDPDIQNHPVMEMMNNTSCQDFEDAAKTKKVRDWIRENPQLAKLRMKSAAMMKMKSMGWIYPGWKNAFSDETHDLLLFDCYPGMDEGAIIGMETMWNRFIKVFPHKHQVIPQMQAFNFKKGGIWRQYNFWKEKMGSSEFDNPYRGQIGVCWYCDLAIRDDPEMQQKIKEVIADVMK